MPIEVNNLDLMLFRAVNSGGPFWLDSLFLLFSNTYAAALGATLTVVLLFAKYRAAATRTVLTAALAFALSDWVGFHLLKSWIGRVRPCYLLPNGSVRVLAYAANVGSMPSLHAANSFAVAFVLTMLDRRLALVAYPVAVLVAVSRVYLGVHWPTDVVGGALWGTLAGAFAWWGIGKIMAITPRWQAKRTPNCVTHQAREEDE